ncbi:unnamed protein product [Phytophthora lilii]|uniref:Unnamed protein product n=1 Tax=Phytophthora lilii TaxID=2077276 RepID=A0A9W6TDA0_9STRA|nr:unnamed protein product [Phytophthora lilii]
MQACLAGVEQALRVQDAVARLDVPLSRENAATCADIRARYAAFSAQLGAFVAEQRALQAAAGPARADARAEKPARERVNKLLAKIQHRITRKRDAWIDKNLADVRAVAALIGAEDFGGPDKALRNELVLVLDHLISAVLLSPQATRATLQQLQHVLVELQHVHQDIDDYIRASAELLERKRAADTDESINIVDAADEPRVKRQRVDSPSSDFLVKVERTAAAVAAAEAEAESSDAVYEVYVSDLPWGTTKEADVASYFGIAGAVVSVQMPTMNDGSTVGVAIVRFAALEGMTLALRMDGYPFNGKNIRVAVHKSK